jgi:malate synthase
MKRVLTPEAIDFAVEFEREFGAERQRLLVRRAEIQCRLDTGWKPVIDRKCAPFAA